MRTKELFKHATQLQRATSLAEVAESTHAAVCELTRYRHSWLGLFDPARPGFARIINVRGSMRDFVLAHQPEVPIAGDAMMEEILRLEAPVVVEDARVDPRTNKALVEKLGNRTIINVPMIFEQRLTGSVAAGSYGDEGPLPPTPEELESLVVLAMQVAAAVARVHATEQLLTEVRERYALERRLESLQRVELMGVLASGVAHDLNNLLGVLRGNLQVLAREPDPQAWEDSTAAIARASGICRQLLTLGRGAGTAKAPVDLVERVEATLRLVRPSIPQTVAVAQEARSRPVVEGNVVQLDQALANLVLNARDAVGKQGHITVEVDEGPLPSDAAPGTPPGHYARVAVVDDGEGVPAHLRQRIFEPLFTTKGEGTGLGLAVVSRVAQQHRGVVRCTSQPGRTCFEVFLPLRT